MAYLYFSLYVILDLFSRYVVGWMVAAHESARLAERLIEATCHKQGIAPKQLTIHADRGAPMRSKRVAELFADLGIAASHSRPRVSNDNPFSEAQFRTVKYRPEFPDRFGSIQDARAIGHGLFGWYNNAHHHSGLRYLTPGRRPLRARGADPAGPAPDPPAKSTRQDAPGAALVTPDDPQHRVIFGSHVIVGNRPIVLVNSVESLH